MLDEAVVDLASGAWRRPKARTRAASVLALHAAEAAPAGGARREGGSGGRSFARSGAARAARGAGLAGSSSGASSSSDSSDDLSSDSSREPAPAPPEADLRFHREDFRRILLPPNLGYGLWRQRGAPLARRRRLLLLDLLDFLLIVILLDGPCGEDVVPDMNLVMGL